MLCLNIGINFSSTLTLLVKQSYILICEAGNEEPEKDRTSSVCWFTLQMITMCETESDLNEEKKHNSDLPHVWQESDSMSYYYCLPRFALQKAGIKSCSRALKSGTHIWAMTSFKNKYLFYLFEKPNGRGSGNIYIEILHLLVYSSNNHVC